MKTSSRWLLASILAVALLAPPAYPQKTQDQLNQLMTDVLNLTNAVKQLQGSSDQKSGDTAKILEQILARFGTIDASLQRLDAAVAGIRADNEKSAQNLQEVRTTVGSLKTTFTDLNKETQQELVTIQNQMRGVTKQIADMQTTDTPLPTPLQMFNDAWLSYNQGFLDIAVTGFREFLRNYPKDPRAQIAQITIGEALSAQKKFEQAQIEYEMAYQNYPEGDKRCVALYKKGRTLVELKQNPQATAVFNSVVKECPGTSEAASASEDLKKLPKAR